MGSYTTAPWKWFVNRKNKTIYLATVDRGRQFVIDTVRWGMRDATFRFQGDGIMVRAEDLGEPNHNGESGIDHPDAQLIEAAPLLVEACREAEHLFSSYGEAEGFASMAPEVWAAIEAMREALRAAGVEDV